MALKPVSKFVESQDNILYFTGETTHDLLATSPSDPLTYKERVGNGASEAHLISEMSALPDDPEGEKKGVTVFHKDEHGICLYPHQLAGFMKAAGDAIRQTNGTEKLTGGTGTKWGSIRSKLDRFVTIHGTDNPDKIYLYRIDGDNKKVAVMEHDDICSRSLRAQTAQGQRVTISESEAVSPGARFDVKVDIMAGAPITEEMVVQMMAYGRRVGLLQWRNSGKGRFDAFVDVDDPDWKPSTKVLGKPAVKAEG